MKLIRKIFLSFIFLSTVLTLTACEVHWFDQSYDVPWYVVAIPVALFTVIMLYIGGTVIARKTYVCPACKHRFHPSFWVSVLSLHVGSDRYFKCPRCGKKSFCKPADEEGRDDF